LTGDGGFDEHALPRLERMVGARVLGEVLDLYAETTPRRLEVVREALRTEDLPAAAVALHDLKSSAGMVGASGLQQLAEEMERLARQNQTEALRERLPRLEAAVADAARHLGGARERRGV